MEKQHQGRPVRLESGPNQHHESEAANSSPEIRECCRPSGESHKVFGPFAFTNRDLEENAGGPQILGNASFARITVLRLILSSLGQGASAGLCCEAKDPCTSSVSDLGVSENRGP